MGDDPRGAMYLLSFGRSRDEQYDLLRRLGYLSPAGLANRIAVVLLLDRVFQEHVDPNYPPSSPAPAPGSELLKLVDPWPMPPGSGEMPYQRLARHLAYALAEAGYLNPTARGIDNVYSWWEAVAPLVAETRDAHNPTFAAIAPPPPPPQRVPFDPAATLIPAPPEPPPPRTDPLTCTACGRPFPRSANFCVWCGHRR